VFALVALLTDNASAGVASLAAAWPQGSILSVCFFGGEPWSRGRVRSIANEWTGNLSLHFDFGPDGSFNSCDDGQHHDVRVAFEGRGYALFSTYLGTES
jgi:hypothetical protein